MSPQQVSQHLKLVPDWSRQAQAIRRTFQFKDFPGSIAFVDRIARLAQKANHHPDIGIAYDRVTLTLVTHDQGGLSEKDFALARQGDGVFDRLSKSILRQTGEARKVSSPRGKPLRPGRK